MEFGVHKPTDFVLLTGKLVHSQNKIFDFNRGIQELEQEKT